MPPHLRSSSWSKEVFKTTPFPETRPARCLFVIFPASQGRAATVRFLPPPPPPSFFKIVVTFSASLPPPSLGAGGLEAAWARYCQPHPFSNLSAWRPRRTGNRGNYGGDALAEGVVDVEDVAFGVVQARQGGQFVLKAGSFPPHPQERTMC